jgi:hypothetical protein
MILFSGMDDRTPDPDRSPSPRQRRPRCNFHYKIDETLRDEDRDDYRALVRSPQMRIDDAHAWLLARGYQVSRSAVARHRRRLLAGDVDHRRAIDRAEALAHIVRQLGIKDVSTLNRIEFQMTVLQHLKRVRRLSRADDRELREKGRCRGRIASSELLALSKLVQQCMEMERRAIADEQSTTSPGPDQPVVAVRRTDEELRQRVQDILSGRVKPGH